MNLSEETRQFISSFSPLHADLSVPHTDLSLSYRDRCNLAFPLLCCRSSGKLSDVPSDQSNSVRIAHFIAYTLGSSNLIAVLQDYGNFSANLPSDLSMMRHSSRNISTARCFFSWRVHVPFEHMASTGDHASHSRKRRASPYFFRSVATHLVSSPSVGLRHPKILTIYSAFHGAFRLLTISLRSHVVQATTPSQCSQNQWRRNKPSHCTRDRNVLGIKGVTTMKKGFAATKPCTAFTRDDNQQCRVN